MNVQEALSFIQNRTSFGIKPGLERIEKLLSLLDNPQNCGIRFVHIAGTNGKGSTAAMLAAILQEAGFCTGLFTSPHLLRYTERFQVNGQEMTSGELADLVTQVAAACQIMEQEGYDRPTEFEIGTAIAFCYFKKKQVQWAIIETGLGGRLDSTNVLHASLVILTSIGKDHTEYLGNTLGQIAAEKAGIIKSSVPVFCGFVEPEARVVIAEKAIAMRAPVYYLGEDLLFQADFVDGSYCFDFIWQDRFRPGLKAPFLGYHQIGNACLAVAAAIEIGVNDAAVQNGLRKAKWPGRLEVLSECPWIVLDGAHNEEGFCALNRAMEELWPQKKIIGLFAVLDDKAAEKLQTVFAKLSALIITKVQSPRAKDWTRIASYAPEGIPVYKIEDLAEAYQQARALCTEKDLLLAAGSLYMIGELRGLILGEKS